MEVFGKRKDTDNELASLDKLCDLCEFDNVNTQANGFCNGCEQYVCNACFSQHIRAKSCRHHTLSAINVSSDDCLRSNARPIQCKQHETEIIKYYCRTHEAVGCGDCIVSKHNACKSEFIKDLSDNFQQNEDYKTFVKKTETQISKTKELENKIEENKKDNELMLEKSLHDIKQFRLDINKYLDKVETDITCQARKVMEENNTLLAKLENSCSMLSTTLEEIANLLNSELYKDNVLFIHVVECKPKLPEVEKAISDMRSESMKKYEFVCDQQLNSLVTSAQQLGVLSISASAMFPQATECVNEKGASSFVAVEDTVKNNWISEGQAQGVREYMTPSDVMFPQFLGGPPHLGMEGMKPFAFMPPRVPGPFGGLEMKPFAFMPPRVPGPFGGLQMEPFAFMPPRVPGPFGGLEMKPYAFMPPRVPEPFGGLDRKPYAFMPPRVPEPFGGLDRKPFAFMEPRGPEPFGGYTFTGHLPPQQAKTRQRNKETDGDLVLQQEQKERDQTYSTIIKGSRQRIKENENKIEMEKKKAVKENLKVLDLKTDDGDIDRRLVTWCSRISESESDKDDKEDSDEDAVQDVSGQEDSDNEASNESDSSDDFTKHKINQVKEESM